MKKLSEANVDRDKKIKSFLSLNEEESKIHYLKPDMGQFGMILVVEAPACDFLAQMLNVPDGWTLNHVAVGNDMAPFAKHKGSFVAYAKGDRLTFFENERDFSSDAK